jgi:hypothetical protein
MLGDGSINHIGHMAHFTSTEHVSVLVIDELSSAERGFAAF